MNWSELGGHPAWRWLFDGEDSPVRREISTLEAQLHNSAIRDPHQIQYIRGRLSALQWLNQLPLSMYRVEQDEKARETEANEAAEKRRQRAWMPRVF